MRRPYSALMAAASFSLAACSADPSAPQGETPSATPTVMLETALSGKFRHSANKVDGEYIVALQPDAYRDAREVAHELARTHKGQVARVYRHALRGFMVRMSETDAKALAADPRVKYVEENAQVHLTGVQTGATWGLDRVDQVDLPLDQTYTYNTAGAGVNAYIIDTGIRVTHADFGGRAFHGFNAIADANGSNDCNGHGTHVAGTVGGSSWGVAKAVNLYAVRVLDCGGSGTYDGVIAGVDWVTQNHMKPAVANMSLGGGASQAVDDAVTNSIAAGVVYALAAGNDSGDACTKSPARTPNALTVGATTNTDARASYSNYGTCVDIFAPGTNITSAWYTGDTATNTISGTSMASPHVAGAAALYLSTNPTATPDQVGSVLTNLALVGKVTSPGTGSPNLLLYTASIGNGSGDNTAPVAALTAPAAGSTVVGSVTVTADATDDVGVTRVSFFANGALLGTDTTAPYSVTWDTTQGGNGAQSLVAKAYDGGGNVGTSSTVSVTVNNPGIASYDAALKAPKCATLGAYCDTGTLVVGRGTMGPETNAPNTIASSCADGNSGSFHGDESLDRLRVTSVDGTDFAVGKTVKVEATVWAWSSGTSDRLDLYYAADANNPSWTYLTTLAPSAGGAQVLSTTFTLPAGGSLQAVRGNFRYNGTVGSCSTGGYDDRDDLVFAVSGGGDTPPPPPPPPPGAISLTATGYKQKGTRYVDLAWSGASGTSVDVFRNGTRLTTTANDGAHTDSPSAAGTFTYRVCNAGTTTCSADRSVTF